MQKRTMLIGAALTGALLVSGGAGAVAGGLVTSAQIKNGTIRTVDVKNNTLRKADLTPKIRTALAQRALDGVNGLDGLPGIDGTNGVDGVHGLSAYDLAVEAGFEGSLEEWLDSLRGVNGRDGAPGQDGQDGEDGKDGAPGQDGVNGKDGAPGQDGKDGEQGPEGPRGPEGAPGQDGKDAAVQSMTICLVKNGSSQQVKLATNGACVGTEAVTIYTPAA